MKKLLAAFDYFMICFYLVAAYYVAFSSFFATYQPVIRYSLAIFILLYVVFRIVRAVKRNRMRSLDDDETTVD